MGAEGWVLRGGNLRTPPGPEGSNGKEAFLGAAGVPGLQSLSGIVFFVETLNVYNYEKPVGV
jgi:hypothetical protein